MERKDLGEENSYQFFSPDLKKFGDLLHDDLYYVKYPDVYLPRASQLPDIIASGVRYDRKHFRVRNREVDKFVGRRDFKLNQILSISGAAIGILANRESDFHSQSFIEIIGTSDAVITAEALIAEAIRDTYEWPFVPVPLMPAATVFHHQIIVPFYKVVSIRGIFGNTILKMERWCNAWIEIDPVNPPPGRPYDRVVNIYGSHKDVIKVLNLVKAIVNSHVEIGRNIENKQQQLEEGGESEEAVDPSSESTQ